LLTLFQDVNYCLERHSVGAQAKERGAWLFANIESLELVYNDADLQSRPARHKERAQHFYTYILIIYTHNECRSCPSNSGLKFKGQMAYMSLDTNIYAENQGQMVYMSLDTLTLPKSEHLIPFTFFSLPFLPHDLEVSLQLLFHKNKLKFHHILQPSARRVLVFLSVFILAMKLMLPINSWMYRME
jgi:hypothetical protein